MGTLPDLLNCQRDRQMRDSVARTTATPSTTASNAARPKAPAQWSVSQLPLLEDSLTLLCVDLFSFTGSVMNYQFAPVFIPGPQKAADSISVRISKRRPR